MLDKSKYVTVQLGRERLGKRSRELSLLLAVSDRLAACTDLAAVCRDGLDEVQKQFSADAGRLYLMDPDRKGLSLAACRGTDPSRLEHVAIGEGFSGLSARTRSFIAMHVTELEDPERVLLLQEKGFAVIICVPLIAMDMVEGVLNLAFTKAPPLDQHEVDLLAMAGHRIAVAIQSGRLVAALEDQARQIGAQKDAIQFFSYTAFHDLKSPAVGVLGLTQRLMDQFGDKLGDAGREYCRLILQAATRVETLVREINLFIRASQTELPSEEVDLAAEVEGLRQDFSRRLEEQGVELAVASGLPTITANRLGLVRALQNLIDNALMHGGPRMTRIEIGHRAEPGRHVIWVADDGVAVPPDERAGIFEPFKRSSISKGEGTGLGLAIVREIARRHGGDAWLESKGETGAAFYLSLKDSGTAPGRASPDIS